MRLALPPLWRLLLLLWPLWGAAALGRLAVVRPFAASDAAGLVDSFAEWNTNLPCLATLSVPVDLILCFSQNLSADAEAAAATQAIVAEFNSRRQRGTEWAWPLCFRRVRAVSAFITPEDDIYLPDDVTGNPDWVKGPNLQFLAMAEAMEDGSWGEFDAWFMMEMDCKTQRPGWLEELVQEVKERAPFAVLGSFYRGDQWDAFPVPPAVRHHINGNAVYNHSSPFTHLLVSTLKAAMANGPVLQAFDVFGAEVYLNSTLEPDQLGWYAGDSQVIGNYAHTPMLETYFAGEALVHGGWLYAEWNSTEEPLTLVVSDFGRWDPDEPSWTELETFEAALARGHHPFRHVVVLRPAENATATPYVQSTVGDSVEQIWYREVARNDTVWFDWCHAPVNTTWFLYTNVFFDFRHRVDIRQTPGNGSVPVASYVPSGSHYCQDSEPCVFSMRRAKNFTGTEPTGHVDVSQLLIHTAQRDAFCAAWRTWSAARPAPDCDPIPGPTADEYAAFLLSTGATGLYAWEDILKRGQRSFGVQRTFPSDPRPCAFPSRPTNATLCEVITEELTCASTAGCAWRPHFEVCFNGSRVEVPQAPTLSVSYHSPEGCGFNYTSPIVVIRNAEPQPLTLQLLDTPGWLHTVAANGTVELPAVNGTEPPAVTHRLLVSSTSPRLLFSLPVPLYSLKTLTAVVSQQLITTGDRVTITGASSAVEGLEIRPLAGLRVASTEETADGWLRPLPTAAPASLTVEVANLAQNASLLALTLRIAGRAGDVAVRRCTTLTLAVAAASASPWGLSSGIPSFSPLQGGTQGGDVSLIAPSPDLNPSSSSPSPVSPRPSISPRPSPSPSPSPGTLVQLTSPDTPVVTVGGPAVPGQEAPKAIDGTTSPYSNLGGAGAGFIVTLAAPAVVTNLVLYPANGDPRSDPASYQVDGTNNASVAAGLLSTVANASTLGHRQLLTATTADGWAVVAAGAVTFPPARNAEGLPVTPTLNHVAVQFGNTEEYTYYRITFPTLRGGSVARAGSAMSVGEVQLMAGGNSMANATGGSSSPPPSSGSNNALYGLLALLALPLIATGAVAVWWLRNQREDPMPATFEPATLDGDYVRPPHVPGTPLGTLQDMHGHCLMNSPRSTCTLPPVSKLAVEPDLYEQFLEEFSNPTPYPTPATAVCGGLAVGGSMASLYANAAADLEGYEMMRRATAGPGGSGAPRPDRGDTPDVPGPVPRRDSRIAISELAADAPNGRQDSPVSLGDLPGSSDTLGRPPLRPWAASGGWSSAIGSEILAPYLPSPGLPPPPPLR